MSFLWLGPGGGATGTQDAPAQIPINTPYVQTPPEVVDEMLKVAGVKQADLLYDLGCGDGRIVIAAARRFGTHGVGVDLSRDRIEEATRNARSAGVADLVQFRQQDLFDTEISKASVVMIYLLPEVNLQLRPKLLRELKPGSRVVSNTFGMGDWKPDKEIQVQGTKLFYWVIPAQGK